MLALRRRWAGLSILNKAIVLSCTFVIPILLVVGLLLNDFYAYRKESDRILSEYVLCTDYMDAVENEMSLLGEMTFAAPGSVELEDYADAVQNTSLVWERLRTTASAGGRDGEVLRQVIGRMMKSYRARQKIFLTGLRGGTFDADEYEQLRAQGEYLTQYADRLMDDFLMGRPRQLSEPRQALVLAEYCVHHRGGARQRAVRGRQCCTMRAACCCGTADEPRRAARCGGRIRHGRFSLCTNGRDRHAGGFVQPSQASGRADHPCARGRGAAGKIAPPSGGARRRVCAS